MRKIILLVLVFMTLMPITGNANENKYDFNSYKSANRVIGTNNPTDTKPKEKEHVSKEAMDLMNAICSYQYVFRRYDYSASPLDALIGYPIPTTSDQEFKRHDLPFGNMEKIYFLLIDPSSYSYKLKSAETGIEVLCRYERAKDINGFMEHISGFMKSFLYSADVKEQYNINDRDWNSIRNGKIKLGFNKIMAKLALGDPWDGSKITTFEGVVETWIFKDDSYGKIRVKFLNGYVIAIVE